MPTKTTCSGAEALESRQASAGPSLHMQRGRAISLAVPLGPNVEAARGDAVRRASPLVEVVRRHAELVVAVAVGHSGGCPLSGRSGGPPKEEQTGTGQSVSTRRASSAVQEYACNSSRQHEEEERRQESASVTCPNSPQRARTPSDTARAKRLGKRCTTLRTSSSSVSSKHSRARCPGPGETPKSAETASSRLAHGPRTNVLMDRYILYEAHAAPSVLA